MKFLCIFLIGIVNSFKLPHCNIYKCANDLGTDVCIKNDEMFVYSLKSCSGSKLCNFTASEKNSMCKDHINNRFPGEYCTVNDECMIGICYNYNCMRNDSQINCTTDIECNVGYYCNTMNKTCENIKKLGQNCSLSEKCDSGLACGDNKCVKIGSLELNSTVISPSACKTFYSFQKHCKDGPKLNRNNIPGFGPIECTSECHYFSKHTNYNLPCVCGMDSTQKYYCNPGPGDMDVNDVNLS